MGTSDSLREHVLYLLGGGGAHLDFDRAVAKMSAKLRGVRPEGLPYSAWELVEHMRLAQWDILQFTTQPDFHSPSWPEGFWPEAPAPPDAEAWDRSLSRFRADAGAMRDLVADPGTDLLAELPHAEGYTCLREALLVADHNAYHLGQLVAVRRCLGAWED